MIKELIPKIGLRLQFLTHFNNFKKSLKSDLTPDTQSEDKESESEPIASSSSTIESIITASDEEVAEDNVRFSRFWSLYSVV